MDWALDPDTHDMIVTSDFALVDGVDAIKQHMKMRIWLFEGELFYNTTKGVPYFRHILVKQPNIRIIESIFSDVILETPGAISLDTFDMDWDRRLRTLEVNFDSTVTGGVVNFNGLPLTA